MRPLPAYIPQCLPAGWQVIPVKSSFEIRLGKMLQPQPLSGTDELVQYLKANNVQWSGVVSTDLPTMWASRREMRDFSVAKGDLLVCEGGEVGRAVLVDGVPVDCIFQNALHRIRNKKNGEVRFLKYLLECIARSEWFSVLCNRATIAHLTSDKLRALLIPCPPLEVQREIAEFLDRETASIDKSLVAKDRVLANVEDRMRCVVNEAVCRGVNSSTPKTSTGIPWFGDAPSHWELIQLRRVIDKFVDYRGRTPEKVLDGIPLVTAVNIKGGRIDFSLGMEFMPESDYEGWMVRGLPDSGDVLVTTEAPLGEVAQIEDTRVALAQRIILLKANKQKVTNEYLKYFFLSAAGQGELWTRASGSTAIGIKASKFKGLTIVVPPINEQREIVRHLDCEMEKLHQLRSVVTISLGKLTEYRSALITAAVTGQIDVRKYRSQEATASCQ